MTRDQAWAIVQKHVKNENLRKHMLAVEAAMGKYFQYFKDEGRRSSTLRGSDPNGLKAEGSIGNLDEWKLVGLLHDFDWEIHPTLEEHPMKGTTILEKEGLPEHLRRAILSHAERSEVPRETLMEKTLFAVDELTGLIVATALVKERKLENVAVDSIKKKWKQKSFAQGVNREDIERGARELDIPLEEHIKIVLKALQEIAPRLGL